MYAGSYEGHWEWRARQRSLGAPGRRCHWMVWSGRVCLQKQTPLIYDLLRAFFPHHIMSLYYYSGEEFFFRNHEEIENSNPILPVKETLKTGFVASSVWRIHLLGETVLMNRIREVWLSLTGGLMWYRCGRKVVNFEGCVCVCVCVCVCGWDEQWRWKKGDCK